MAGTHPRPTEGECALALLLYDIPLTVNCVTAHPCPALLCAIHSYGPSSSADAFGISHDATAEYLKQRHIWFICQHIYLFFHVTPSGSLAHPRTGNNFHQKSAALHESNSSQSVNTKKK